MYSKAYLPERYNPIISLLERVRGMEEGDIITMQEEQGNLAHTRLLLYDWFFHMGLKNSFRTKTVDESLVITKIRPPKFTFSRSASALPEHLESHLKELVGLKEEAMKENLKVKRKGGAISEAEEAILEETWKQVML